MNDTLRPTRYRELSYRLDGPACWRIYGEGSAIGSPYATKAELLADLERVAREYGCLGVEAARPLPSGAHLALAALLAHCDSAGVTNIWHDYTGCTAKVSPCPFCNARSILNP